jgi:hypothetical protein
MNWSFRCFEAIEEYNRGRTGIIDTKNMNRLAVLTL